ncbi:hypothetical protein P872_22515 [Rhodonellum psychrophilum GCM71 = DSM 17998]|uniref:3-deoxy-D-manno-octulosonic acid transferase n=3 Tax=Cytophagaceae TaxID=89373 RepID=U5C9J3_9BACT|nr:hypothetical protein P872_22515 [Rhodonellum psychrophilum GCM71 = DSM 17998]SDY71456.1 3-deoxy-D-manno-octulosonic-acid transferase [Rhodonellum ikkaensis]
MESLWTVLPIFAPMKPIYDFSTHLFSTLAKIATGTNSKLGKLVDGRENLFGKLAEFRKNFTAPIAWFHVASLGEYEQARPVIAELKRKMPEYGVVVSFFSPSGFDHVSNKSQSDVDFITYLPIDTPRNAKMFLGILQPALAFFVKYDLWANHILTAKKMKIPLFLISASMRADQIYFKVYGGFFRKILESFAHIFTQNRETIDLLEGVGIGCTTLTGDTRYDRVKQISQHPKSFPEIKSFVAGKPVLVVGSAWEEDMDLILPFINTHSEYCYIVAPHDINVQAIEKWQKRIVRKSIKYSEIGKNQSADVLFIDNIGMLSSLYQYARIAYIGGAFGKGLHNILEPLAYGIPVVFGNLQKVTKFPEAEISKNQGCGFSVSTEKEFEEIMGELEDPEVYQKACSSAEKLVSGNLGSAAKIIQSVMDQIKKS